VWHSYRQHLPVAQQLGTLNTLIYTSRYFLYYSSPGILTTTLTGQTPKQHLISGTGNRLLSLPHSPDLVGPAHFPVGCVMGAVSLSVDVHSCSYILHVFLACNMPGRLLHHLLTENCAVTKLHIRNFTAVFLQVTQYHLHLCNCWCHVKPKDRNSGIM
jgi:hypothetical protein